MRPYLGPARFTSDVAERTSETGVMKTLEDGTFELARPVTGAEAVAAVRTLEELAERPRQ